MGTLRCSDLKQSMQDICVIVNPAARSERARRAIGQIESFTRHAMVCTTSCRGEAETIARNAVREGFRKIVAAGGDGTVNEVVNGIADSDVALGLLPLGTVNVFATELGLPSSDLENCWDIIERGYVRSVDLPRANETHFVQLAGIGLDAQAVKETSMTLKRNFGPLSYLLSAAQIASRRPPKLFIESDDTQSTEGSFVLVGNGRLYGGPFPFFKQASVDDGLFDVLVFKHLSYLEIVGYLHDVIFRSEIRTRDVEYFQTRALRVSADEEVPVEVDGELTTACPVQFSITRHGLRVLTGE